MSLIYLDVEIESRPENVLAKESVLTGLLNGEIKERVFDAGIDVTAVCPDINLLKNIESK